MVEYPDCITKRPRRTSLWRPESARCLHLPLRPVHVAHRVVGKSPVHQQVDAGHIARIRADQEVERLVRRANIALARPGERAKVNEMVEQVAALRGQAAVYGGNIPLLGGATLCKLLRRAALSVCSEHAAGPPAQALAAPGAAQ